MNQRHFFLSTLFLLCAIFLPTTNAETVEGSYQTYNIAAHAMSRDNPSTSSIFVHNIDTTPTHIFAIDASYAILSIEYTARFQDTAAGIWRYDVLWDDTAIPNCFWNIETVNILGSVAHYPMHRITCLIGENILGTGDHEFIISRNALSGSPTTINHETISYQIDRTDLLEPDMTNEMLETFITFAPLATLLLIIIWAEWSKNFLIYLISIVLNIITIATLPEGLAPLIIILVAAAAILCLRAYQVVTEEPSGEDAI